MGVPTLLLATCSGTSPEAWSILSFPRGSRHVASTLPLATSSGTSAEAFWRGWAPNFPAAALLQQVEATWPTTIWVVDPLVAAQKLLPLKDSLQMWILVYVQTTPVREF